MIQRNGRGSEAGGGEAWGLSPSTPLACRFLRQEAVIRKTPADQGHDQLLGLQIAFGHRVDGPLEGYPVGFREVQPQQGAGGQGRLPPGLDYLAPTSLYSVPPERPFLRGQERPSREPPCEKAGTGPTWQRRSRYPD